MSSIEVHFNDNNIDVYIDETYMGNMVYSINPYHNGHYYLKLQLQQYDIGVAKELFDLISPKLDKPLQIMISSEEKEVYQVLGKLNQIVLSPLLYHTVVVAILDNNAHYDKD